LRQLILLTFLLIVSVGSYMTRTNSTSWEEPLWVTIYPIAADGQQVTENYIQRLTKKHFGMIERFMMTETKRYSINIEQPVRVELGQRVSEIPPAPPQSRNPLRVAFWSLQLRWWARREDQKQPGPQPDIRLYVVYHDPAIQPAVPHSLGLQKGMIGVVHVFADRQMQGTNNFIIAHEMLHTLGASDKYALDNSQPLYPAGYADRDKKPLFPQKYAEIMGGRIPRSDQDSTLPRSLKQVLIGPETAVELRWDG
jgi:hypothetical protein